MTIRLRLALIFSVIGLGLLFSGGVLFVTRLESGLENGLTATAESRADAVIADVGPNPAALATTAVGRRELFGAAGGSYTQLLAPDGRILGSTRAIERSPLLTPKQTVIAAGRTLAFNSTVSVGGGADAGRERMRILAKRVGRSRDVVVVAISREVLDKAVASARRELVFLDVGVLLLAAPGSWLLTRAALRPVERMRREVSSLDVASVSGGVHVPDTRDEIARLGVTFNALLGRLHEALSREQALVADAGHELRTPLTVLKGELELARRPGRTREELAGTIEVAAEETDRLVRLTEGLLFLSLDDSDSRGLERGTFDVAEIVRSAVRSVSGLPAADGLDFSVQAAESVPVTCDGERIRQAVDNLLVNAAHYARPGRCVTASVSQTETAIQVRVADDGPGFPPDFLPIAFQRFTRADGSRGRPVDAGHRFGGNGLGLAIVRSIMARHGGTAIALNRPEGGAEVVLTWPAGRP